MSDARDDWQEKTRTRRRSRRRRRRERQSHEERVAEEEILYTPEQRAYRRAQLIAEQKTKLASEAIRVGAIVFLLMFWLPGVAILVLIFAGFKPARRAYRLFVEPQLRERFIEQEVQKQVHATLSHERQLMEGRHARSLEQLSASIAHEIRNPITAAKSLVQQMEEEPTSGENVEYARVALEELQRVERSVSHLLRFARDEEMGVTDLEMADVVDSAVETFRDRLDRTGVALERHVDTPGALRGDAEKLRRVVINLVGNAIDALTASDVSDPKIEISLGENLAGSEVWLRVRDNGPGMDAETQERLFDPFYTSKADGTGLGLAISRKVIDAHGGVLEVDSTPGAGAAFLITLPRSREGQGGER